MKERKIVLISSLIPPSGPVAQMKRAAGFYPAARGFKSYQARQFFGARIAKMVKASVCKADSVSSNLTACSMLLIN
jgi:hypothetical protein